MSSTGPIVEEVPWWRRSQTAPTILYAPYPRSEVVRRLQEATDSWWTPLGKKDAFGTISEDGGWLRRRTAYRNSMKTAARLKFTDEGSRTRIELHFGIGPLILVIVASWIMMLAAGIVGYTMTMQQMPDPSEPAAIPLFVLPVMAATAICVVFLVSRATAKTDSAFLTDFVKRTLSASEVGAS